MFGHPPNFRRSKIVSARKNSYTCTRTHLHTATHTARLLAHAHRQAARVDVCEQRHAGATEGERAVKDGPGSRVLAALAAIHQQNLFLELWQRAATFLFRLRICFYVSRH